MPYMTVASLEMSDEPKRNSKFKIMADYATNLFFASTENERDLDKVETFLDDNFADKLSPLYGLSTGSD